jgi:hypothetical protein
VIRPPFAAIALSGGRPAMVFRMGMGPESPLDWLEPGGTGGGRARRLLLVLLVVLLIAGAVVLASALWLGR